MKSCSTDHGFQLTINAREDGSLEAAYIRFCDDEVARTEEVIEATFMVDYGNDGHVIGMEFLAPTDITVVRKIAEQLEVAHRRHFDHFVEHLAPRGILQEC